MAAEIVTYSGKTVTSQDDALVYESALGAGGVIYGAEVTIKSGSVLHVAAGHAVLCGRKITIGETDVSVQLPSSGTLLGRLYLRLDLSNIVTPVSLLTEVAAALTDLVQQANVNIINGIYEINLATFTANASTMSNLVNVAPMIAPGSPSFIAPIETGSTALRSYTTGQYLINRGKLYRATTTIAQGAALVAGTNMEAVMLSDELYSVDQSLNGFGFGIDAATGKPGYILPGTSVVVPFKRASGTAKAGQVLTGYTFSNDQSEGIAGTMPNRGSIVLSPEGDEELTAPAGYYSGIEVDGSVAYAAGQDDLRISGRLSASIYSKSQTGAMSYTIPVNNNYKYVLVLCSDADGGNNSTASASMTGALFSINAPTTGNSNPGYSYAKIIMGLASISHTFSWPKDAWEFTHNVNIVYVG